MGENPSLDGNMNTLAPASGTTSEYTGVLYLAFLPGTKMNSFSIAARNGMLYYGKPPVCGWEEVKRPRRTTHGLCSSGPDPGLL